MTDDDDAGRSRPVTSVPRQLLEDVPVGVFLLDAERQVVWYNAAAAEILAVGRDELIGFDKRDLIQSIAPMLIADSDEVVRRLLAALEGEEVGPIECHLMAGEGRSERWLEHTFARIEEGELKGGWVEYCRDVSDRKRAEQTARELEVSDDYQRMIFETMAGFTYRHDLNGIFHYLSPSVERVTGLSVETWSTHYTAYLTDNPVNQKAVTYTEATLATGQVNPPYRVEIYHADGSRMMLEVSERPYYEPGPDGEDVLAGVVGIALDITPRYQLEDRVQQVHKLQSMGVLAGGIAHDFNNLLMAILGNATLAIEGGRLDETTAEHLAEIVRTSRRAAEICQQMLAYSGKGTTLLEPFDLSALVREMGSMLEVSISKKVELVYELGEGLPAALGDPTQVRQVALNLLTNASEAIGDEAGRVTVRTGVAELTREELEEGLSDPDPVAGTYLWLEVEDTGAGMDEVTLERIYDPFFSTKFAGRGLGLSTVLGIMRGHEGAIRIWSTKGSGTRFRVLFHAAGEPAADHGPGSQAAPDAHGSSGAERGERSGGLVLLVDDEPAVRKVGTRMLERLGFEVITADDGRQGLDLFRERRGEIRFTILDMTMPVMGGDEVFREIRSLVPDARVILVSGYDEGEAAKHLGRGFKYEFLQKPFEQEALAEAVQDLLAGT